MLPSEPVFPDAPMIRRLREREADRPEPIHVVKAPFIDASLRTRLDKIVENHPFMEGAP